LYPVLTIWRPRTITAPTCLRMQVLRIAAIIAIAKKYVSQSGLAFPIFAFSNFNSTTLSSGADFKNTLW
jgi:hypothetical protein